MAHTAERKNKPPAKQIPPLPGGMVQDREGIARCDECYGEVIWGRRRDGTLVSLSPVFGQEHVCREPQEES